MAQKKPQNDYQPIENYGIIGDLRTSALVGLNGSIDFMCVPDFDSPSLFAKMLDLHHGGYFQIAPTLKNVKNKQLYFPETNILLTRFLLSEGIGETVDFMPIAGEEQENLLIRRVSSIKGEVIYRLVCAPRFNYARDKHVAKHLEKNAILFKSTSDCFIILTASIPLRISENDCIVEFSLKSGERADFILQYGHKELPAKKGYSKEEIDSLFQQTNNYWKAWASKCTYQGRWREIVVRSALVLKLLISKKYGSIIASPTFGLPEYIGEHKNWDYRYVWIRDAAFVVYALMRLGYTEETDAFMKWVIEICEKLGKKGTLDLMYGIDGRKSLPEKLLKNLEGYKESGYVRIGNAAYKQEQLDIYGELMDSVYLYDKYVVPLSHETWIILTKQVNWLAENWERACHGIWEVRNEQKKFLHTRFMCWVAIDRAIRLAQKRSLPCEASWIKVRDAIYKSVFQDFWNAKKGAFVAYEGAQHVDASCLLMPLVRFISPKDPMWLSTLACVEKELVIDSLVYRFQGEGENYLSKEGTFSLCSFWYAECLSRAGNLEKAEFNFEKMLSYANHLGLYSEQLGFQGEHLGNFPQAFSHLSLISAAYDINKRLEGKDTLL